ncbi:MAG: hypothetical protein IJQ11_12040 [Bacteroidales bacterium]|nr:hypothetical protein [Bacteroidales bacterium]MBR3426712.1 hypothetical protein [Bacteroidales bacterium]
MKKCTTNLMIALCATLMCVHFTSCNKDLEPEPTPEPQPTEEFTVVGNWRSVKWQEIDDEEIDEEYTDEYYVIFTETNAKFYLYDFDEGETIDSDYSFKESDNTIIYFQKAYDDYGYMIVGKVFEAERQLLIEVRGYEDGSYQRYFFRKQ